MPILILDDDRNIAEAMSQLLKASGYATSVTLSYPEAMRSIEVQQPELILSDVNMPCQNGFEFAKDVLSQFPSIPIVFVSAMTRPEHIAAGRAVGAKDYVFKPVDPVKLLTVVREYCGTSAVGDAP